MILKRKFMVDKQENALKDKTNGGGIPLCYLLDKKAQKLIVDLETALQAVEIFGKYSEGVTVRSIIKDFNAHRSKTRRGKPSSANSFKALQKNHKYVSEYSDQDVVIPGGVPTIVSKDLFYHVK